MIKNYLLELLHQCSVQKFGQDAIEWAIVFGLVRLTYDLDRDVHEAMSRYDEIIEAYRLSLSKAGRKVASHPAPMERAVPRRRAKRASSSSQKENAA